MVDAAEVLSLLDFFTLYGVDLFQWKYLLLVGWSLWVVLVRLLEWKLLRGLHKVVFDVDLGFRLHVRDASITPQSKHYVAVACWTLKKALEINTKIQI